MTTNSLKNIPLKVFRNFLISEGLNKIRTTGGHEVWARKDLLRPVILPTHNDPVAEHVVKNNLRTMDCSKSKLITFLNR